ILLPTLETIAHGIARALGVAGSCIDKHPKKCLFHRPSASSWDEGQQRVDSGHSRKLTRSPSSCRSAFPKSRSIPRVSPLSALRLALALPSGVRGPVDRSHGFQFLISFACRARRSGVHPFAILSLQKFVPRDFSFLRARGVRRGRNAVL